MSVNLTPVFPRHGLSALQHLVPVTAAAVEPLNIGPTEPPAPDCGGRWGKPANFDFSPSGKAQQSPPTDDTGVTVSWDQDKPPTRRVDISAIMRVEYDAVRKQNHKQCEVIFVIDNSDSDKCDCGNDASLYCNKDPVIDLFFFENDMTANVCVGLSTSFSEALDKPTGDTFQNPRRFWVFDFDFVSETNRPNGAHTEPPQDKTHFDEGLGRLVPDLPKMECDNGVANWADFPFFVTPFVKGGLQFDPEKFDGVQPYPQAEPGDNPPTVIAYYEAGPNGRRNSM